jgi:hypothetical protein
MSKHLTIELTTVEVINWVNKANKVNSINSINLINRILEGKTTNNWSFILAYERCK